MHDLAALRRDSIFHYLHVVVHLGDLLLNIFNSRAFPLRTPGILIHVAVFIAPQCFFEVANGGLHLLNLRLNGLFVVFGEVDALAGPEGKGYIEVPLDIEEGISLIC